MVFTNDGVCVAAMQMKEIDQMPCLFLRARHRAFFCASCSSVYSVSNLIYNASTSSYMFQSIDMLLQFVTVFFPSIRKANVIIL